VTIVKLIPRERKVRTLFLSDLHLGSPHAQVTRLLTFLQGITFEALYIVGDLFDGRDDNLPPCHELVMTLLKERALAGVRIIFIPGNHDARFRETIHELNHFGFHIVLDATHVTVKGRTIALAHGDDWDWLGSAEWLHKIDRWLPMPFWEIVRKLLWRFMDNHVAAFEKRALKAYPRHNVVMCGHVHSPALNDGYANCGDWVVHCSAIVEHFNGELELVYG
jgi:UDP-2,3-diacylglucosamine pyrophosphatase LpxH